MFVQKSPSNSMGDVQSSDASVSSLMMQSNDASSPSSCKYDASSPRQLMMLKYKLNVDESKTSYIVHIRIYLVHGSSKSAVTCSGTVKSCRV